MRNVPELRFDGFDGEWEENRLENLGNAISGNISIDKSDDVSFSLPVYKVSDMNLAVNNIFMNESHTYVSSDKARKNKMKVIKQIPSIIFAKRGAAIALERKRIVTHPFLLDTNMMAYSPNNDHEIYFLKQYLDFKGFYMFIQSGALPAINIKDINSYKIKIPNYSEQEKIGDLFRKIDALIEIQEGKVSKMEDFKKSMFQKTFPKKGELVPEFRFDGFDGEWKYIYVKDIGNFLGGTSIESHFNKKGEYKVISIGSYSNNSKYIDQGLRVDLNDKTKSKLLSRNDLAMVLNDKTTQGNIIGRALLIDEDNKYIFNQRTQRISPNFDKYNSLFLYYLFNSDIFRNKIKKISQGNTQIYVNWPNVESISLKIPTKKEQEKIGQFFKNLDAQIENEEKLLESYKNMKKSLLQKMFV